jgi:hypothetical protein
VTTSQVADLIAALRSGAMSLEEVADRFRQRTWPRTAPPAPDSYVELASAAQLDPRTNIPGSFDDVLVAYDRGEITRDQYRTLVEAAAESIRAEYGAGRNDDAGRNDSELGSAE